MLLIKYFERKFSRESFLKILLKILNSKKKKKIVEFKIESILQLQTNLVDICKMNALKCVTSTNEPKNKTISNFNISSISLWFVFDVFKHLKDKHMPR